MKKGAIITLLIAVSFVLTFSAMDSQPVQAEEDYSYTLVAHSASIAFWRPVQQGAEDAAEQLGVDVTFTGPADINHSEQTNTIESLIVAEEDGIATTLTDPEAYDTVVQEAIDEGIPVVGFNADAPDNPRMAFIGQDEYEAGQDMAREIINYVGEEGKIALATEAPGHVALEERLDGASDILDQYDYEYDTINTTTDLSTAVETVMDYYHGNPETDGWFGVSATSTEAGVLTVDQLDLEGEVYAGGFDLTPDTLEGISEGYAHFTVDQHPYLQGYYSVHALHLYNEYGIHPVDIDTGGGIIDSDNVDEVMELSEEGYR